MAHPAVERIVVALVFQHALDHPCGLILGIPRHEAKFEFQTFLLFEAELFPCFGFNADLDPEVPRLREILSPLLPVIASVMILHAESINFDLFQWGSSLCARAFSATRIQTRSALKSSM